MVESTTHSGNRVVYTNDIEQPVELSLQEAYSGTERHVHLRILRPCRFCRGSGEFLSFDCPNCHGQQFVPQDKHLLVQIPAGVASGSRVRISGEGHPDVDGGQRGDLYLLITVKPDSTFTRSGDDLHISIPVSPIVAQGGGHVQVPTPAGNTLRLHIPPGAQDNDLLCIQEQGMPRCPGPGRGHLYVHIQVPAGQSTPGGTVRSLSTLHAGTARAISYSELGNYRLLQHLGQGGFADVYLGEHRYLHTPAAIKLLRDQVSAQERQQFLDEASIIAHLSHPHIIRVLDFGIENNLPYLVMEYAPKGTLLDRHPEGVHLPVQTIIPYVNQIASALQYAHDQQLVHRDVKPANMLVMSNNTIVLSDFGIAVTAHRTQSLRTQEAIGTVTYMAPEQIQGKPRTASDQYSLAVVVYEWLTGTSPFRGDTVIEIAMQHINKEPPSPQARIPSLPPAVSQIILKALAKEPNQRFASIQGFANALEMAASR